MSTHNPEHALIFADRVLVLKEGKAMVYGRPDEILNPELIKTIYGVTVELHKMHAQWGDVPVFVPFFE
jgi:iron complex transport system ATP-binding protein